jgi:hypothetical protein
VGVKGQGGYIAISRSIFDHALLAKNRGPFSRLEAWQWLIREAAWKAEARRVNGRPVHLERGQLAGTIRQWAKAWRWSKSKAARFLDSLQTEDMIKRCSARVGTMSGTMSGTKGPSVVTIVAICNYERFQHTTSKKKPETGQLAGQLAGQLDLEGVVHQSFMGRETLKPQLTKDSRKRVAAKKDTTKPRHGAKGRGLIWLDYGTEEWRIYAADHREATGTEILPKSPIGGKGNWFRLSGARRTRTA